MSFAGPLKTALDDVKAEKFPEVEEISISKGEAVNKNTCILINLAVQKHPPCTGCTASPVTETMLITVVKRIQNEIPDTVKAAVIELGETIAQAIQDNLTLVSTQYPDGFLLNAQFGEAASDFSTDARAKRVAFYEFELIGRYWRDP
jgi:hypothetical protein